MHNPWNKYLDNKNNLFEESDSYYLIIYAEKENLIKNLEFSTKEEKIEINSEIIEDTFINMDKSQNSLLKSSIKENKNILIQFSPIIDAKNIINAKNDQFSIISQFDNNNIQKGKIYSKQNRTYSYFDDPLIDSFLSVNMNSEVQYEIKYSIISNQNNIKKDNINDNYNIELYLDNNENFIRFNPLLKNKEVVYYIFIFFDNKNSLISPSYLKSISEEENSDSKYIIREVINTKENFIKISINSNIADKIKSQNNFITILAEEKETYNIIMNYDVLINNSNEENNQGEGNTPLIIGIIILCIFVIILIVALGYLAYKYFLKKKVKSDEELLKGINNVDVNVTEDNQSSLNNDEGI